jgi:hypothetical protein
MVATHNACAGRHCCVAKKQVLQINIEYRIRSQPTKVGGLMKTQRICNWKDYNEALIKRGEIIFSFNKNHMNEMFYSGPQKPGGIRKYTPELYEFLLTIKVFFRLSWRTTLGFARGLIQEIYKKEVILPNFSHAAREANKLNLKIKSYTRKQMDEGMEIAFDSTGVNVYTTSGYHQRKYGKEGLYRKRDQWKKIHLAIDLNEQQILSMVYTKSNVNDCETVGELTKGIKRKVSKLIADGAYDTEEVYKLIDEWGAEALIPPAITSKAQSELKNKKKYKKHLKQRDDIIYKIRESDDFETGLKKWKKESGYHLRSLIETCMFRFKRIFGFYLHQKKEQGRINETITKINILNKMTLLGMPKYSV